MALELEDVRMLLRGLSATAGRDDLLVLGSASVFISPTDLSELAATAGFRLSATPERLDPFTLGNALGFDRVQTLDVNGEASLALDLHVSPPDELVGAFDCVIDAGVLFWCSDPGAALRSIYRMTRPGGLIVHVCAATGFFGRGYYDVHPLLFDDFYAANGCELIASSVRPRYRPRGILASVSHRLRLRDRVSERRSGDVYVTKSRLNRIELGPSLPAEGEPLFLPNNVLGTYCFKKGEDRPVQMPIRTAPYAEEEVGRADA